MGIYPMFCICFSSPLFVHSSTKLVLLSSKAETTICHFCNSLVPNMIPKIQLVLLYHIQLVPLMQQTPGSQRLFCIIQRKYWGWETNAIISLFYLLEINDCSPGLLSTVQCWQHKHGRIPPFTSFYVIHFSYGQITEQFQMFKLDLEKAVKPEIKLPTSIGSSKKEENSRKTCTFTLLTMPKPFPVWITTNCGRFLKRWKYQTTWTASWEICMQVKKLQFELDMEQWTGSKLGQDLSRLYIVTLRI